MPLHCRSGETHRTRLTLEHLQTFLRSPLQINIFYRLICFASHPSFRPPLQAATRSAWRREALENRSGTPCPSRCERNAILRVYREMLLPSFELWIAASTTSIVRAACSGVMMRRDLSPERIACQKKKRVTVLSRRPRELSSETRSSHRRRS